MFVVDTNVLVYAANSTVPQHSACREHLLRWRQRHDPWYLTWSIGYEFLRVSTHLRVLPQPLTATEAWSFLTALLASPGLRVLGPGPNHPPLLAELLAELPSLRGNRFHDAHIAVLMREHGVSRIVTGDTDFHRFSALEVIDPLGDRVP